MIAPSALSLANRRLTTFPGALAAAAAASSIVVTAAAAARNETRVHPAKLLLQSHRCRARMLSTKAGTTLLPRLPILEAVAAHDPKSTVVVHSLSGRRFTYGELLGDVARARERLREAVGGKPLTGERVAFLIENSYDYVVMFLAIMAARAIAVPLSPPFPAPELQYILDQSAASVLISSPKFAAKAREVLATDLQQRPVYFELPKHTGSGSGNTNEAVSLADQDFSGAGLMLYTSGTTNRPKGVLLPEHVLTAQCRSLHQAWEYSPADHLLHVLPLHHIHGTVNAVLTPLFAGSSIEFMFPFNADAVWKRFAAPFLPTDGTTHTLNGTTTTTTTTPPPPVTFFTVVPTVYSRLLSSHKSLPPAVQAAAREAIAPRHLRVNISGSAALPTPVKAAWADLSGGNVLLERYGMTEVGMALSCGLSFADRVDASVGWPLPSVEVRLVDTDTGAVIPQPNNDNNDNQLDARGRERAGEIQLRGPTIFREYWRNPDATAREFVDDAGDGRGPWFKTGDVAVRRPAPDAAGLSKDARQAWARGPMYFILGRKSADIIKTGGEKVSALEVERELLALPEVAEAAVVAVPSGNWGHKVGAVVILDPERAQAGWTPLEMRRALKSRLAAYKIPQVMRVVDHIPRNAMGKINKKELVKAIFAEDMSGDEK
ncbi:2-succinylbenzoate-CoA ligase [Cordyceps fumosorosea ARSEF 2679]|uniref:2-succinylbenzoate-CoA ligase n=1 Tax=Cordyceps fumosorosea (strain ARSEF 2679) TaxID=1081104 RepID=A0A162KA14_CORFA|nr:2-succinylbenzoate-CoA ligase [Cordyceps fumosorosea ARSEF 2679]OAA62198.1 2-succinylbenzoate-CoA ligase [Cordyceps fumosorosea ARSEF 2679]